MGETVDRAVARAAIRTAGAHQRIGRIDPRRGKLSRALAFTFATAKVTRVEVIGDPVRLRELDIAVRATPVIVLGTAKRLTNVTFTVTIRSRTIVQN